jgi:predicted DNA-binding transcriptional regulator AlpA
MTALIQTERPSRRLGNAKAVGRVLDLNWRTVYRLAGAGKIPSGFKLGASRRSDMSEIEAFIAGGCKPPKRIAKRAPIIAFRTFKAIATGLGALWAILRLAMFAVDQLRRH